MAYESLEAETIHIKVTGTDDEVNRTRTDTSQNQDANQNLGPNLSSTLPHALLATRMHIKALNGHITNDLAEDDEMKNLMMSWYYAGYYTGLREGKQKARQAGTH